MVIFYKKLDEFKLYKKLLETFKNSKKHENGKKIYKINLSTPPEYQMYGCKYILKVSIMSFDKLPF